MECTVGEFIKSQVADWDDDVISGARFKAFSGQRSDWEARFQFWRDLIIKVARHLGRIIIDTDEVKNNWFVRQGLTPLCLNHVLLEMYRSGDLFNNRDVKGPTSAHFLWLFKQVASLIGISTTPVQDVVEGKFAVTVLVKERADQVKSSLTESHWTSHCVMTMERFQNLCGGFEEANVVMGYFLDCRRAQYLLIDREDRIEGVKISLVPVPVTNVSQLDYDILHLHWTLDRLQKQLEVIDSRCKKSKTSALSAIQDGNKQVALRHVRYMKMTLESKAKCIGFMDRVEEVLGIIVDTESTKKVSEAIQLGARSIKENGISVEEVHACLQDLDSLPIVHLSHPTLCPSQLVLCLSPSTSPQEWQLLFARQPSLEPDPLETSECSLPLHSNYILAILSTSYTIKVSCSISSCWPIAPTSYITLAISCSPLISMYTPMDSSLDSFPKSFGCVGCEAG